MSVRDGACRRGTRGDFVQYLLEGASVPWVTEDGRFDHVAKPFDLGGVGLKSTVNRQDHLLV
jgi:hypothetical protein